MKKRIKANFYTISGYKYDHGMTIKYELPDGCLYSGWGSHHPTKITAEDLPEWYVKTNYYSKYGYANTKGVVDVIYRRSFFDNHWLKDAMLGLSYHSIINKDEDVPIYKKPEIDEYFWGNDILCVLSGIEKYSPEIDTTQVREGILQDYNAYAEHENEHYDLYRTKQHYDTFEQLVDGVGLRELFPIRQENNK